MTLDTPEQCEYLLSFLDTKRDELHARIKEMEDMHTDHVALYTTSRYNELREELEMNALLTVRAMNDKIQLDREITILSN